MPSRNAATRLGTRLSRRSQSRRGQALVEFALVALIVYLLLAAIITFGFMIYASQGLQQAADTAAREISRTPLPAISETTGAPLSMETVLYGNFRQLPELTDVRTRVFDQHYLVLDLDTLGGRSSLAELVADLPVVNAQLVPLMISDQVDGRRVLRYPGAVFEDANSADDPDDPPPSGLLVSIPMVVARASGNEQIDWVPIIEEIDSAANPDPFLITSKHRGIVALRLNYPYQSPAMSSFEANGDGPFEPTLGRPNVIGEVTVIDRDGFSPAGSPVSSDREFGPYTGVDGLGRQAALGQEVRPYSRVISTQAVYRREVVQ